MLFVNILILCISLHSKILNIHCQNAYNFVIKKIYWPEGISEQKVQFFINPKNFIPGYQLVDMNYSSPIPVGNNAMLRFHIELDSRLGGRESWVPLFTINEEFCKVIDSYLGQLVYDMERTVGVMPKSCPIPKGTYHAVNYTLNFRILKLQTFPFGDLKVTCSASEKSSKEKLLKFILILNNNQG